jgi:hypothetical protein
MYRFDHAIESARFAARHRADDPATSAFIEAALREDMAFDAASYTTLLLRARLDRSHRVSLATGPGHGSMAGRAQDYGLVPHAESRECFGCATFVAVARVAREDLSILDLSRTAR